MRLTTAVSLLVIGISASPNLAFTAPQKSPDRLSSARHVASVELDLTAPLDFSAVANMPFRQLQKECELRGLEAVGTVGILRSRLRNFSREECEVDPYSGEQVGDCEPEEEEQINFKGMNFVDESDPNFEFNELCKEIEDKCEMNHWKTATRKLKKLKKLYATPEMPVPEEIYLKALKACTVNRLHGARASEPARKIMEEMAEDGYSIPADLANYCILNCLGLGPSGTHDDCGGIDCALAMVAAIDFSPESENVVSEEAYAKLATTMAKDGSIDDANTLVRTMIVEKSSTPNLSLFADVASAAAQHDAEKVMNVLAFAKAAGYDLDTIASTVDGRTMLASGLVAAEKMDNTALGLRLLTAASKAKGCEPDRGDDLVASHSTAAQRAATLLHKRAVNQAVMEGEWKLAVKLLELMMERSLKPSTTVWRNVVTCCAKAEKSKKATSLLLDWVKLSEEGKAEIPPFTVFNTVVNACEICGEQSLTVMVLDAMKKTHETEGNIITFNIALKRLARQSDVVGCEKIIIGMLEENVTPTVVSYTTAIAACAGEAKNPAYAYEWIKRMRLQNVNPNIITYNTALASCLDGKLASTFLGSNIAEELYQDIEKQVREGVQGDIYTSVIPDTYTKTLCRQLMKQLRDNWRAGDIDRELAKTTTRVPLRRIVEFSRSEFAEVAAQQAGEAKATLKKADEDNIDATAINEAELEFAVANVHRTAEI